ncbi:MAG TPA: PD-(D/E)XK nuclease family protein, partial [Anaerolineaceae bacterium]
MTFIPILIVLLVLLAGYLFWQAARHRAATGLPGGRVIYADPKTWGRVEAPLYDARLGLTGKPDYLVRHGEDIIPVEVKTGRTPSGPRDGHIYQLAAYCLLVERTFGKRPPYGILRYRDRTFTIDYTQQLEQELEDLLDAIR